MSKETRQFEKKEQTARKEPENFRTRSKRTREGLHAFEGPRGRKAAKGQRAHEGAKARTGHADREGREARGKGVTVIEPCELGRQRHVCMKPCQEVFSGFIEASCVPFASGGHLKPPTAPN